MAVQGGGKIKIRTESDLWQMKPEDIIVINSAVRHQVLHEGDAVVLCSLSIPRSLISHSIDKELFLIWCNSAVDKSRDFTGLRQELKCLIKHCLEKKKTDLYYQGKLYQILYQLTEHYLVTNEDVRYQEQISRNEERIWQILSYIHENYNKDITLNELSDHLYLTNSYLSRFFKKVFGVNFGEYLNKIKLHHAARDLLYTTKNITRIAMDNGFSNMASFNKSFRSAYQMTPKEYKAVMHKQIQEEALFNDQEQKFLEEKLTSYVIAENTRNFSGKKPLVICDTDVREGHAYKRPWRKLINVGNIASLRDYRIRSELLRINSSLKFTYARVWNILCSDMLLGRYVSDDVRDYDFSYFDECIDFLLQNHLKPFLQMGYKKSAYNYVNIQRSHGVSIASAFSFASLDELLKVLHITLKHLLVRYGMEELNSWCFEVWHPSVCYSLPDMFCEGGNEVISKKIYWEIRKILPEGKIGGAEFAFLLESERLYKDLLFYKEDGISFDFITCVSFPYQVSREAGRLTRQWQSDQRFMKEELENLKRTLDQIGWGKLPIWVTEYSFTLEHRNPLNDTRFKGAYILKNMNDVAQLAEAAGYWLLSDVYSEGGDSNRLLYGGSGIVTKDGVNKPVYYALYFLSILKPLLVAQGENFLLTTDGNDTYSLICYNMKDLNYMSLLNNEDCSFEMDTESAFEDMLPLHLRVILDHVGQGKYRVKRLTVDERHGDVQEWVKSNDTGAGLKRSEIWHLCQTCMPEMKIYELWVREQEKLAIDVVIGANNFIYFEIERVH